MAINVPTLADAVKAATEFAGNDAVLSRIVTVDAERVVMLPIELTRRSVSTDSGAKILSLLLKSVIKSKELPVPKSDSSREL
jgi:hypothetical protein